MVDSQLVPMSEVREELVSPALPAGTLYQMTMTHIPTGITVRGTGPSPYRVRRNLQERLSYEVYNHG